MKQECRLSSIWTIWAGVPALAIIIGTMRGWWVALFVTIVGIIAEIGYVRMFPHISNLLGYGSVADVKAHATRDAAAGQRVTLYTALGCPFCPMVRQRLDELQHALHFELSERDVTFHPQVLTAKGIRSVPAVETGGRFLVGTVTSEKLEAFLKG